MSTWGLMPDDINENWTEERLALMFVKHNERVRAESGESESTGGAEPKRITDQDFFRQMGVKVETV